ncbi:MAG: hypothetical protein SVV88_11660 [Pseudomonadota bacterium]|nr:hypothetical protein [Pseudomonadota bacterium]
MAPQTKIRQNNERKFVTDYVLEKYPGKTVKYNCPLGNAPEDWLKAMGMNKALRSYRPFRPEVDAVILLDDEILLIEAKILKVLDGMSKLIIYRDLVAETPELQAYRALGIRARVITPKPPSWVSNVAKKHAIEIEVYRPEWIEEYYTQQERYWTSEERVERENRKAVLKRMGYE